MSKLNFRFDHEPPKIKLLPGGRIKDGERLKVSYYHGMGVNRGQVTVCMSEPEVYQIWEKQAELMHKYLAPSKYLLSMDEIRAGGSCQACKQRNLSMAQILGDCITKQVSILRQANPKTEVFIWSDMLDPNHNAHGNYYLVEGDYTGSWQYVPKDLTIVCWYYEKRKESLGVLLLARLPDAGRGLLRRRHAGQPARLARRAGQDAAGGRHHVHDLAEQVRVARPLRRSRPASAANESPRSVVAVSAHGPAISWRLPAT